MLAISFWFNDMWGLS